METFLKQVARKILREHSNDADRVLLVFNNHRSELFLRHAFEAISAEEGRTFFLPRTTVIDDLVADLGGLKIVPNEFLLFELYRIHMEIGGEKRKYQTFEEFIAFGDTMLSDFSEIDRYCVDARNLFINLHDLKAIGEWDIEDPAMSPFQRSYLEFYHSLYDYYRLLRERLTARGEAYGGMAYRHVAEHIGELAEGCPFTQIYFVGFNAMTECERMIIGEYARRGIGRLLTDGDPYYASDPMQEAGHFLRKHRTEFPEIDPRGTSLFAQGHKKITVVECPEAVLQCKYAGQLLAGHSDWLFDPESTAVVLADESLLMPTLNALPDSDKDYKVNISMGFAYADSGIHLLVLRMLSLYRQATAKGYYHTDLVEVLSDHHIGRLLGMDDLRQRTLRHLERENLIRCHASDVATLLGTDRLSFLFPDEVPGPDGVLALLRRMAELIADGGITENNRKEKQALGGLAEILAFFDRLQAEYSFITDTGTLEKVYTRIARRHSISFLGQPLSGLQILGMLETRNLDFKRVILLSANEGILPSGRSQNTLIPYELQRAFHLPTYEEKDCVFAYNFYHLLQRAEEVYLLYSSEAESMGKGEESRFIKQVRSELAVRFPGHIEVTDTVVDTGHNLHRSNVTDSHHKTPAVMERLRTLATRGFSPTSLNNFMECPLRYYYSNILNVNEPDTVEEDLDASQLGTCVHAVLEHIYTPYIGRAVDADGLRQALDQLPQLMQEAFEKLYSHGRSQEGRNSFLHSVGESQVRHILQREKDLILQGNRIEIVALEQEITHPVESTGAHFPVNLKGIVDRIDRFNGRLRVIDYKTGRLDDKEINVTTDSLESRPMPGKWLQLMCYALMYSRKHHLTEPLLSGIYPLRHLKADVSLVHWDGAEELLPEHFDRFEQKLATKLNELLDPETEFAAPEQPLGCTWCPVRGFCSSRL